MTDIVNEEDNTVQLPEEEQNTVVTDNGTTYESQESGIIAKEEADRAKQWAEESERQANIATTASTNAASSENLARLYKESAQASENYVRTVTRGTAFTTVSNDLLSSNSNIKTVSRNIAKVQEVANIADDIDTVLNISEDITAVANNETNINTVSNNIPSINTVVANITDIQNASSNAQKAKDWAIKMNGLVDGEDYSAKYYAQQAQEAASDVSNKANKDLSNLSSPGEARFTAKQNTLVSGTNIKTINGQSVLGSGDLTVTASTVWGGITGTLSAQTDLQNALNAKANNADLSNYVTTNTAQTISESKTFSGSLIKQSNALDYKGIHIQNTQLTKGTTPSSTVGGQFVFQSKDGLNLANRIGGVEVSYESSGNVTSRLLACQPVANSTTYASLAVVYPASGNPYTYAPAPTDAYSATSGTQIATTGWTASNFVNLAGAQTISGAKTFADSALTVWAQLPELNLVDSDVQKGTVPPKWNNGSILYKDKDFNDLVAICPRYTPAKETRLEFICYAAQAASNTGYESMVLYGGTSGQGGDGSLTVPSTYPNGTDNTKDLGKSWARWKQLYAGTTSINTSDERVKQGIEPLPDDVLDAWGEVEFYRYKFNDAVEEKGFAKARYHTGMVAQRIERVFAEHGLNAFDYGLLCYDEWEAVEEEKNENGEIIRPARAAGNRYSLRYEECLCMEAAYQRRRADRIEKRLNYIDNLLKQNYNNEELTL